MAIIWMVGTVESIKRDSFKDGPTPNKASLLQYMDEGDVLVGKYRNGAVASCERLINGKFETWSYSDLDREARNSLPTPGM